MVNTYEISPISEKMFIISDLHLGHGNMLKYEPIRQQKVESYQEN
jgi:calcineurin-like phosphoesterase family protein